MNENLKKLMIQADYPAPEIALRAHVLAELIVKEVDSVIQQYLMMKVAPAMLGAIIKQHFGIK